jgi:prepilin-type N-terminal cleavage/methylation domain-containing protein
VYAQQAKQSIRANDKDQRKLCMPCGIRIMKVKEAFSLVELIIVVAILGIMAAIILPIFQSHAAEAKETASKDNLRILRSTIQLYAAQHGDIPPGYLNDDPTQPVGFTTFWARVVRDGHYLPALPENPFNESASITVLGNSETFPVDAPGDTGWIYKPATREIRLNWPGTDSYGIRYYDY